MTPTGSRAARGAVVLGMGRSGTSSVAGMLDRAGFYAGEPADLIAADETNPTGYYENLKVWRANERALAQSQSTWFDPPTDGEQRSVDPETRRELERVMNELFAAAGDRPLVLKDPRIGVLLPLWSPLVRGVLHPVLVLRHPLEIALSLERRDGTALPVALAMWEVHLTRTLAWLDGHDATVVPYPTILHCDLAGQLVADVAQRLRPDLRAAIEPARAAAALRSRLHRNDASALGETRWLTPRQSKLWALLSSIAPGTARMYAPAWAKEASDEALLLARYENRRQRACFESDARLRQAATEVHQSELVIREQQQTILEQRHELDAARLRLEQQHAREDAARQERAELELKLRSAEHWLDEIQRALSWRMTEPLRRAARTGRRLRRSTP